MVDVILKSKHKDGHTREYLRFKGGVTLLDGGGISVLTSNETRNKILFTDLEPKGD